MFESDLEKVEKEVASYLFTPALTDLDALIANVNTYTASLTSPKQQEEWDDTKIELEHSREHLLTLQNPPKELWEHQVDATLKHLDLITVI